MYANAGGFPVSFMWRFIKCFVMHRNNSGELLDRGSNWLRSCIQITGSTIKGCTAAFVMVQLETADARFVQYLTYEFKTHSANPHHG